MLKKFADDVFCRLLAVAGMMVMLLLCLCYISLVNEFIEYAKDAFTSASSRTRSYLEIVARQ